ncbi:MAG TPA: glycosyl transferase family 28, partial [Puia sp.]|nr:glycosyl transferase family 28 [Puia sp.]
MFFGQRIKILVAPLDWGLGHATRCIPIVKQLLARNCHVILAADGPQKALLQQEFPGIDFIQLPSYGISYSGKDFLNSIKIAAQVPKILSRIRQENQYLNGALVRDKWDAVISDNRFGLYSTGLHSVFITHQLHIENPFADWVSKFLSDWNYQFIERFNECWVPDLKEEPGIAGALSHPSQLPHIPIRYIGPLSRFEVLNQKTEQFDLLIILSGPEPQRSRFEKILLDQLGSYRGNVVLVRGLPEEKEIPTAGPNLSIYNHADAGELNQMIQSSRFVLARSG